MEKEKKQFEGNLIGRSVLYILLMSGAFALIFYLIQYGFFYLNVLNSLRGGDTNQIIATLLPFIIFAFLMAIFVSMVTWRKGKVLWNQWQRQWAIVEEGNRVQRLMDTSSEPERGFEDEDSAKSRTNS
jgi:hypothetical protein